MNVSCFVLAVLLRALLAGVCEALNVSVTPAPVATATEGDNLTLSCLVSQRKRSNSFLVLRWFFSPPPLPPPPPPPPPPPTPSSPLPSPAATPAAELLIVKMTMKRTQLYGNYSRGFPRPRFLLSEEAEGAVYRLAVLNVTAGDRGGYVCRVQEIRRHRNAWRASSNGSAATQLMVHVIPEDSSGEGVWRLFEDVYLCAVLICSLGLLSMLIFALVLSCQYLHTRHRLKVASYYLVKCPESSSGETVTSSVSSSSSSPGTHRKELRPKSNARREEERPPYILTKAPAFSQRPRKPRRLKSQTRRSVTTRVSAEDSLTYAELELVRPKPPAPSSSSSSSSSAPSATPSPLSAGLPLPPPPPPAPPSPEASASGPDTIYAQILFQEKQL